MAVTCFDVCRKKTGQGISQFATRLKSCESHSSVTQDQDQVNSVLQGNNDGLHQWTTLDWQRSLGKFVFPSIGSYLRHLIHFLLKVLHDDNQKY